MPHQQTLLTSMAATLLALAADGFPGSAAAQVSPGVAEAPRVTGVVQNDVQSLIAGTHLRLVDGMTPTGSVNDSTALNHMQLFLKPSASRASALQSLTASQHDPKSQQFHQWITPAQFGNSFGVADQDVEAVRSWLLQEGFTVNGIYPNRSL